MVENNHIVTTSITSKTIVNSNRWLSSWELNMSLSLSTVIVQNQLRILFCAMVYSTTEFHSTKSGDYFGRSPLSIPGWTLNWSAIIAHCRWLLSISLKLPCNAFMIFHTDTSWWIMSPWKLNLLPNELAQQNIVNEFSYKYACTKWARLCESYWSSQ